MTLSDTIAITWHFSDIQARAADIGEPPISDDRARELLHDIKSGHDCTLGINWDVIDVYIRGY
jgi:hypothetical protein